VIVTTGANGLVAPVHDRMPVILDPDDEARRLDPEVTDPADVLGCLGPYPEGLMAAYPASPAVNAVANDGAELIEPLPAS
jgi:putative SOS response-associated peptidase YedK